MKRSNWTVTKESSRPAGKPDECLYCHSKIGEQHKEDCVIRSKTTVVEFTVQVVTTEPESWNNNDIEFHYNESSWCADNLIYLLKSQSEERCLCPFTKAKYIRDATEDDEEDWGFSVKDIKG